MADLTTQYMGLSLKNPVIAASSRITGTVEGVLKCEDAGAGAVVLKSLFEEQILFDSKKMMEGADTEVYTDAFDFMSGMSQNYYIDQYLTLLEEAKKRASVPIIASINCVSSGVWIDYARRLETMGADALELNMFVLPSEASARAEDIEKVYLDTAKKITSALSIPVSMKIGPHFSALAGMVDTLGRQGIRGVVLFNRFFRPDIDIESMKFTAGEIFSDPKESVIPLQWIALLYGQVHTDLAASTGVHDYSAVVKNLLAGARAVQVCSALFQKGTEFIGELVSGLEDWMGRHDYASVCDMVGLLSQEKVDNPAVWERSQYIKALTGIS